MRPVCSVSRPGNPWALGLGFRTFRVYLRVQGSGFRA